MVWKAKYTRIKRNEGEHRLHRVFAYLPTYIDGNIAWLQNYEILQIWHIEQYVIIEDNKTIGFSVGKWINASKRLIK